MFEPFSFFIKETEWTEKSEFFLFLPKCVTVNEFYREEHPVLYVPTDPTTVIKEALIGDPDCFSIKFYTKWYFDVFKGKSTLSSYFFSNNFFYSFRML